MQDKKQQAITLRQKGATYGDIQKKVGVAKSTLSLWLRDIKIGAVIKNEKERKTYTEKIARLDGYSKKRSLAAKKKALDTRTSSRAKVSSLSSTDRMNIALGLYWGEGHKQKHSKWQVIDFTNSDALSVKCFAEFLGLILKVPKAKWKLQIHVHANQDVQVAEKYWVDLLELDSQNIMKTQMSKITEGQRTRVLKYGIVHLRVYDAKKYHELLGMLEGIQRQFE